PLGVAQRARGRAVASLSACDIHRLKNSGTLRFHRERLGCETHDTYSWYVHCVRDGFAAIETMIEPVTYAFGTRPTRADVYLVPQVFNARRFDIPLDEFPKIAAVDAACSRLAAFEEAAPARQPDAAAI